VGHQRQGTNTHVDLHEIDKLIQTSVQLLDGLQRLE
jgi:hypothetical protein